MFGRFRLCCSQKQRGRTVADRQVSIYRDEGWPKLLSYWGMPNLQLINRDAHAAKCAIEAVAAVVPRTLQDLQRVCTMCESHRECARDLGRDPADPTWENYCPNAEVLKMLNALPWVARSEW
jgi:hypothetical protein